MVTLTPLQTKVMTDFTNDNFYENGFDSMLWLDCFMDTTGLKPQQFGGVIASLKNKNMLKPYGTMICLTQEGMDWIKANLKHLDAKGYRIRKPQEWVLVGDFYGVKKIGTRHYDDYEQAKERADELTKVGISLVVTPVDEAYGLNK